ncbi:AMP-binding protein [Pendulispora rubella]|uniref:AMP-binding protein n=1 Tax=Pendulispora rubella TaxID=2741070 RepID=A0ABZ2LC31_9BACT
MTPPVPPTLPGATLIDRLTSAAGASASNGIHFVDRDEGETWFGWDAIRAGALRAAGGLAAAGIGAGDRVAFVLPTSPELVFALLGCISIGAIPFVLAAPRRLGRLEEYRERTVAMLRATRAAALVTDARVRRSLDSVLARYEPRFGALLVEDLDRGPTREPSAISPDDLALVQFSSGTTVHPKPVAVTHRQILANCDAMAERMYPQAEAVHVSWLPLHHDMGLIGCVFNAMCRGIKLVLMAPEIFIAKPSLWLRAMARHRATVTVAPNFAYAQCTAKVRDEDLEGADFSGWNMALCGAEPISAEVARRFNTRFARWGLAETAFAPVYGLAEATLAVTFTPFHERPFRTTHVDRKSLSEGRPVPGPGVELVSVGKPIRTVEIELRRTEDRVPCALGEVGNIWVRSPSVMAGYLDRDDAPIENGWLDTGDLGVLLDGELYITGRAKDIIIINGENHLPHDIEDAVNRVAAVRTGFAAAAAEVGEHGERLLVFVEQRKASANLAEECWKAVLSTTGLEPALVVALAPGSIPQTTSGKIRRGETLRRWQQGILTPPESGRGQNAAVKSLFGSLSDAYRALIPSEDAARPSDSADLDDE